MATAMAVCEVCDEDFDSKDHKPLCLTCGHTFCVSCIRSLPAVYGVKSCPKCRKKIDKPINGLLVNYIVIPSKNKACKRKRSTESECLCSQHKRQLNYLCVNCTEFVCFTCTRDIHSTCTIEVLDELHQNANVDSMAIIRSLLMDKICKLQKKKRVTGDTLTLMDNFIDLKTDVKRWDDSLQDQIVSTNSDLEAWDDLASCVDKENSVKEILHRLKSETSGNTSMLPEITKLLNSANQIIKRLE
ncbi:E3 ubiquitin-protein ligase TRIM31 [Hyalella azteca]|uniref:E3 ubiquitin-protein ligase TRIM31 n=1 Tax=Hyalella azteca TaxID=294128 RepID=A0A8B7PDE9_HYAAZ|nr:E3 ubiquitin-protein ligase TRIM31 [Hyalella azteca]